MTSKPFNESQNHQSPAGQRLDQRHREQLSALVDGELGADEARFLLRRMEHDPELAGCQERWQLLGDVMRGHASALAPAGFGRGRRHRGRTGAAGRVASPGTPQWLAGLAAAPPWPHRWPPSRCSSAARS